MMSIHERGLDSNGDGFDGESGPVAPDPAVDMGELAALLPSVNDPVKLRAATTDAESAIRQAQATAPAEIKADVTVVATTAREALAALQRNNFDVSRSPEAV